MLSTSARQSRATTSHGRVAMGATIIIETRLWRQGDVAGAPWGRPTGGRFVRYNDLHSAREFTGAKPHIFIGSTPMRHTLSLAFALALAASMAACSAPEPAAPPDIPTIDFEKITLANGLDVIMVEDHRLPMVAVNLWYHVGPANEEPGRTGFAHLFEHMMFQGSKHVPGDTHFRTLEGAGGSSINGTTDFDRTNYFETVPSNQLELALWLESDRMGYLLDQVDQANLSNQQDVGRKERRQRVENQP